MKRWTFWVLCTFAMMAIWTHSIGCGGKPEPAETTDEKTKDGGTTDTAATPDKGKDADASTDDAAQPEPEPTKEAEPTPEPTPEPQPEPTPERPDPPPAPAKKIVYYTVFVRGKLKGSLEDAKKLHNGIVKAGEAAARALGDMSHHVYLGNSDDKEFFAIDVWNNLEGLQKYYSNPDAQKAFGQLFDGAPTITIVTNRDGWKQYWENDLSGKAHLRVLVQGKLKGTPEDAKKTHNSIVDAALTGSPTVQELGDLSHYVFTDPKKPGDFFAMDVWNDPKGLDGYLKNPDVQKAFGQLFSAPPNITIWKKAEGWSTYDTKLYTVLVRGKLKGSLEDAKKLHNGIVAQSSGLARQAGDLSHDVYLGNSDDKEFFAIDVWTSLEGLQKYYSNPDAQKAFGQLFDGAPVVSVTTHRDGWKQYWENDLSGKAHLRVLVQGKLKGTPEDAKKTHNSIVDAALTGKPTVQELGDLSHYVFTDPQKPGDFFAMDVWNDPKGLDGYLKNPDVQKAFGQLFSAPPNITIWKKAEGWSTY